MKIDHHCSHKLHLVDLYEYHLTKPSSPGVFGLFSTNEKAWWERSLLVSLVFSLSLCFYAMLQRSYLPPMSLDNESFQKYLAQNGWND
jgi:hypothetical protein